MPKVLQMASGRAGDSRWGLYGLQLCPQLLCWNCAIEARELSELELQLWVAETGLSRISVGPSLSLGAQQPPLITRAFGGGGQGQPLAEWPGDEAGDGRPEPQAVVPLPAQTLTQWCNQPQPR